MYFDELSEFRKEFRKLGKKYKSLPDDLEVFKRVITVVPLGNTKHFNTITKNDTCAIIKARFFCKYLKGNSLRIIYAYHTQSNKVTFIEIYFKGNKANEDRGRIKGYLSGRYIN